MTTKKHTPEPWTLITLHDTPIARGKTDTVMMLCPQTHDMECDEAEANTARAEACVNALAGVANPAAVPELIEAVRTLMKAAGADVRMPTAVGVALHKAFEALKETK